MGTWRRTLGTAVALAALVVGVGVVSATAGDDAKEGSVQAGVQAAQADLDAALAVQ